MNNIEQFIEMCIHKNTGKLVKTADDNILTLDISPLELLYVIIEIEQKYAIPAKDIISNTTVDSFTIRQISQAIYEKKMVINA